MKLSLPPNVTGSLSRTTSALDSILFLETKTKKNPPFLSEVERGCSLNRPMSGVRALCLIAETDHLSPVRVFSPVRAQSFFQMSRGFVERAQTTVLVLGPGIRLPITVISLCQSRGSGYPLCLMSCFHSAVIQANTLYSANTLSKVSTRELESPGTGGISIQAFELLIKSSRRRHHLFKERVKTLSLIVSEEKLRYERCDSRRVTTMTLGFMVLSVAGNLSSFWIKALSSVSEGRGSK